MSCTMILLQLYVVQIHSSGPTSGMSRGVRSMPATPVCLDSLIEPVRPHKNAAPIRMPGEEHDNEDAA